MRSTYYVRLAQRRSFAHVRGEQNLPARTRPDTLLFALFLRATAGISKIYLFSFVPLVASKSQFGRQRAHPEACEGPRDSELIDYALLITVRHSMLGPRSRLYPAEKNPQIPIASAFSSPLEANVKQDPRIMSSSHVEVAQLTVWLRALINLQRLRGNGPKFGWSGLASNNNQHSNHSEAPQLTRRLD